MAQVTLTLETVTPLFLGGAEPRRDEPELRPASFKGELRFWWRALWGGTHPRTSPDELFKNESTVFGNTEGASPIIIQLSDEPIQKEAWKFGSFPGVDYLFFSMKGRGSDPDRRGFSPGQSFQLTLRSRSNSSAHERAYVEACAALWLLVRLGGVGARSRRGAGCLCVTAVGAGWPTDLPSPKINATSAAGFVNETGKGLAEMYAALGWPAPKEKLTTMPEFNILHAQGAPLYGLGKEWSKWEDALNTVGSAYRDFRSRRAPDYQNVKDAVSGHVAHMGAVERAAFGLPIVFYYRSLGGERGTLEGQESDRRASPLVFHVSRLVNNKHIVSFVRFNARLLTKGSDLKLKVRGKPASGEAPDGKLITQFLQAIGEPDYKDKHGNLFIAPMLEIPYP